jgi:hypothetical protein
MASRHYRNSHSWRQQGKLSMGIYLRWRYCPRISWIYHTYTWKFSIWTNNRLSLFQHQNLRTLC